MAELNELPRLLSESEAAKLLRRSVDTVRRERKRGQIGFIRVGARIFYTEELLAQYLEQQRVEPCQGAGKIGRGKLGNTGSRNGPTAQSFVEHGLTQVPDRRAAHHLAQTILTKRS